MSAFPPAPAIHFGLRLNPVSQLESASNLVQSEEWPDWRCLGKARGKFSPMTDAEKTETTRGLDTTGVLLLSALGVLAALVGATLIYFGRISPRGNLGFGCLCASPFWRLDHTFWLDPVEPTLR